MDDTAGILTHFLAKYFIKTRIFTYIRKHLDDRKALHAEIHTQKGFKATNFDISISNELTSFKLIFYSKISKDLKSMFEHAY